MSAIVLWFAVPMVMGVIPALFEPIFIAPIVLVAVVGWEPMFRVPVVWPGPKEIVPVVDETLLLIFVPCKSIAPACTDGPVTAPILIVPVAFVPIFICPEVCELKKLKASVDVIGEIFYEYIWAIVSSPWAVGYVKKLLFAVAKVK